MKNFLFCAFVGAASFSLVACGGGDGDGGGSGVSRSKNLTEVTPAEAVKICEYVSAEPPVYDELSCKIGAIFSSQGDEEACNTAYEACLAEPDDEEEDDCSDAADDLENLPACAADITVGQFEDCIDAQVDLANELNGIIQCGSEDGLDRLEERPAICTQLQETCPDLFGDDSGQATALRLR